MARMIDQIRASKLPSNMMQFAARGALQVAAAENIEILVYLARHNKVFGDTARMTLAGWDEKSSLAVAADPQSPAEVLEYMISSDNVRPALLPALLENPSVPEQKIAKLAISAMRDTIEAMLKSERVHSMAGVLDALKSNPYLKKEEAEALRKPAMAAAPASAVSPAIQEATHVSSVDATPEVLAPAVEGPEPAGPEDEEAVAAYLKEHAAAIAAEGDKPFQSIGGVVELLGESFFPVTQNAQVAQPAAPAPIATAPEASKPQPALEAKKPPAERQNTMQKINGLDVKGPHPARVER